MKKLVSLIFIICCGLPSYSQQKAIKDLSLLAIRNKIKLLPYFDMKTQLVNLDVYRKSTLPKDFTYALNGIRLNATDSVDFTKVICIEVMPADYANHTLDGAYTANVNFFYNQDTSLLQIQKQNKTFFYVDNGEKVYLEESELGKYANKKLFQLIVDTTSPLTIYKGIDNFFKITSLGYLAWDKTVIMCDGCMLTRYPDYLKISSTAEMCTLTIKQGAGNKNYKKAWTFKVKEMPKEKSIN